MAIPASVGTATARGDGTGRERARRTERRLESAMDL
jgi:hypothetical protein